MTREELDELERDLDREGMLALHPRNMQALIAQARRADLSRGKGGQHVPFHGDFASVPPSALSRLEWWSRELRRALTESEQAAKDPSDTHVCLHPLAFRKTLHSYRGDSFLCTRCHTMVAESRGTDCSACGGRDPLWHQHGCPSETDQSSEQTARERPTISKVDFARLVAYLESGLGTPCPGIHARHCIEALGLRDPNDGAERKADD